MAEFTHFATAVKKRLENMAESGPLYKVEADNNYLWDAYLESFPAGTNPIFRERTHHDCQCCKQFIRRVGAVVSINEDLSLTSIWDVEVPGFYQEVADAMSVAVKARTIENLFLTYQAQVGFEYNYELLENGSTHKWEHFHGVLPVEHVQPKATIAGLLGRHRENRDVFLRTMRELTTESGEMVIDLIDQNSLYRGGEHRRTVELFLKYKKIHDQTPEPMVERAAWTAVAVLKDGAKTRNTVIGTLLIDLSEGVELDRAVASFEAKVAPTNYKRPKALITKAMITRAKEKVESLNLTSALPRRYAVMEDLTVNNVLFANRNAKQAMGDFEQLMARIPEPPKNLSRVEEIPVDRFLADVLPKASTVELLMENRHVPNLSTLIAPVDSEAPPLLKWGNRFSWSYEGNVTDSIKERVKKAGGGVTGVLRFSIQWNDGDNNPNDFDAHCREPNGNLIDYPSKGLVHASSGILDVDIITPGGKVAVENITWSRKGSMQDGEYIFLVHCYSHNGGTTGFTAEIEYEGKSYLFTYDKGLKQGEKIVVAKGRFSQANGFALIESLPMGSASKEVWNVNTETFLPVSVIMNSPNHWDGQSTGNRHVFFMLEGCKKPGPTRGLYNEFLRNELTEHRRVFEVLGKKMQAPASDQQLSGLGFSTTKKDSVVARVTGSFNRTLKVIF